ncbi:MAG TPA: 1-deoxy-D-xylulose-5-phosphate synthase [Candidatus Pullilachnospira stercoravium]|uniref:1-deoxy-D-xylulose-5-phosphate synthase n=1 Tax=Candidatus Pullilachnospira stercoravium TaxID=2840913 RepID=A0A9D1NWG7_9FIRM|nr:1-deoxy-D-xylulose-5-phosphate synthase [Candidatus Pullilachnospira stercoravium]
MMLDRITKPNDVKKLTLEECEQLADEIRQFLIRSLSETGGHLAPNLGVVELTIALHRVLNFPKDKLIWDVGHQAYTHKILTGRKDQFPTLRKTDGLSGFPKRKESDCDAFDTGHSSTSISAGLGLVRARELQGENFTVISVIGDGALTGGMAYEALNNAADLNKNFIIVLNDNEMSITKNVGGMSNYLGNIRTAASYTELKIGVTQALKKIPRVGEGMVDALHKTKNSIKQFVIPGMLFENMGLTYLGPVDGHNISQMVKVLQEAKRKDGPVLVHVLTEKGRGYAPAVRHPARFHGTAPFEIETGLPKSNGKATYTDIFSTVMRKFGDREKDVVAISAAMIPGTGLKRFGNMFPNRMFDVGIAEEHAVTFAAGLALGGLRPVVAIYSSFLQRAVDQILQDVCMQNLPVVFAVDRAGLVGSDGETHHGCFDLSYLSMMPNMTVMAPKNKWELSDMLKFAIRQKGPVAIRYPRGEAYDGLQEHRDPVCMGKAEVIAREGGIALLAVGSMVKIAREARRILKERGCRVTLVNMRFVKPLDTGLLDQLAEDHSLFVTLEENVKSGGFGEAVLAAAARRKEKWPPVQVIAIEDQFVPQGSIPELLHRLGMDAEAVADRTYRWFEESKETDRREE